MMDAPRSSSRTVQALRVAAAAAIALIVSEWWHLPHTNLAVWTTHMVMSSHPHTAFQKGVERIAGRGAGILLGTLIVSLFGAQKLLALGLEVVGLLAFFYAHFCGRLAYTYQNAGLYLQAMFQLGDGDPSAAWVNGGWMFLAIVVGVAVASLVTWITNAERDLSIVPGEGSLLPIRGEPLGHAAQVTATMLLAQYVFFALDMPPDANIYSLFMISVIPDFQKMRERTGYFVGGILAGIAYAVPSLLLLNRVLHLPMFVALVGLGEFLSSYLAQSKGNIQFVGTEMGTIFPLIMVLPCDQIQTPGQTFYNIIALFTFTLIAVVVGWVWVAVGLVPARLEGPAGKPSAARGIRAGSN
ncbi:MAG: FUSC family protein [Singulisphaera sp.]|nr:FUSC family protein [Singulisphaera sp.]